MSIDAMKFARDWIAEKPELRPCSAGKVVSMLTTAIAAAEKAEPIGPITAAMLAEKDALLRQALEALEGFANITNDSQGVKGYHLNGDIAEWDEFDEVNAASNTIEAIRQNLGVKND